MKLNNDSKHDMTKGQIIEMVKRNLRDCLSKRHNKTGGNRAADYRDIREIIAYLRSLSRNRPALRFNSMAHPKPVFDVDMSTCIYR
jgi:hypothetical protein